MNMADIGMIQSSRGLGFPQKPLFRSSILLQFLGQELQRNFTVQRGVVSQENLAHAPLADLFDDFVMGNGLSDYDVLSLAVGVFFFKY